MLVKLTIRANFVIIYETAFTREDPKSTKRQSSHQCIFCTLGIWSQSFKRNLVFKKSKLVLNLLTLRYLNLNLTTILFQSELS